MDGSNSLFLFLKRVAVTLFIFSQTSFFGCVDIVSDINFPDTEPKVVVHSFISPADTAVHVMLSWSNPVSLGISQEAIRFIDDATVRIAEKGQAGIMVPFYARKNVYALSTSTFPIGAGKHYTLTVEVPGHETVTGTCYVPFANNTLQVEKYAVQDLEWSELIHLEYHFTDLPGQKENFYAPAAYLEELVYIYEEDTVGTGKRKFQTISGENYISNKGREGRRFMLRAEAYNYRWDWVGDPPDDEEDKTPIYVLLLTTDEHYYQYHRSLENYAPGNPFAEPVLIYSNIKGGLGVFAGFNRYEVMVEP